MNRNYNAYFTGGLLILALSYFGYHWDQSQKLDAYYLDQLQTIKKRMLFRSTTETPEELDRYQDHVELCMHLDRYNGPEIMKLRTKAFKKAIEGNA